MTSVFCVRANGGEYADHFKNGNYVAIGWFDDDLSDITEEQILTLCGEHGYEGNQLVSIKTFFLKMKTDDIVVTPSSNHELLYIGRVDSDPSYFNPNTDDGCPYLQRRSVKWSDAPIPRSRLPRLRPPTVSSVSLCPTELRQLELLVSDDSRIEEYSPELAGLNELADELLLDVSFLKEIEVMLDEKPQVIFQGPPGTGKTYVAQKLAEYWAKSPENVILVQFHPSYAYEDFVQGFRPVDQGDGQVKFKLRDGPLLRAAERAQEYPDSKHFLVIDEINRGNLAKVFGELYFLLEYRDRAMNLQYSDTPFTLPGNLYIIGTMNTADRTIALVDLALRRRFSFVKFHPDKWPVQGLLRRWLDSNAPDMAWVADLIDNANEKLNDRHAAIGPSYFMKDGLNEDMVCRIWKYNVLPYIEEHLFGEHDRLSEFDYDAILNADTPDSELDEDVQDEAQELGTDSDA